MIDKAREVALKVLYRIDKECAYSNIALDDELKKNSNGDFYLYGYNPVNDVSAQMKR